MAETTMKMESQIEDTNEKCSTPACTDPFLVTEEVSEKLAQTSLVYYNEAARNRRDQEFTLARVKCCTREVNAELGLCWYHLNFIAQSNSEEHMFFAEVRTRSGEFQAVLCQFVDCNSEVECKCCDASPFHHQMVHPVDVPFFRV